MFISGGLEPATPVAESSTFRYWHEWSALESVAVQGIDWQRQQWTVILVSRVFEGLFKGLSNKLQIGFKRVSRIFQGFFLAVSRWIPECFKGLSRQFQEVSCFMALVAGTRAEGGLVHERYRFYYIPPPQPVRIIGQYRLTRLSCFNVKTHCFISR